MLGLCCCMGFSLGGGYPLVAVHTLLVAVTSRRGAWALGARRLSSCRSWVSAQAAWLWCTGLAALQHVASSWNRDLTCVSFIGKQILHNLATKEAPFTYSYFNLNLFMSKTSTQILFREV